MDSLKAYHDKRDFSKTNEPQRGTSKGEKLAFVIQRHHASQLHYDFRLELAGTLKSWAVPKGPSLNPQDKRLAMMVEDHPIDYKSFEGEIPKGNYGAGNVLIWDKGYYSPLKEYKNPEKGLLEELEKGNLKFVLNGKRLKGEFALVKIKSDEKNAWLLIKHGDKYATDKVYNAEDFVSERVKKKGNKTSEKTSRSRQVTKPVGFVSPMLAETPKKREVSGGSWVYEPKLDGYRIVATVSKHMVHLYSRNQINYTTKFQQIATILSRFDHEVILDGEVVCLDKTGKPDFQLLQNFMKDPSGKVYYYVFDLLHLNGISTISMPLSDRKKLLEKLISSLKSPQVIYVPSERGKPEELLKTVFNEGREGIIAKKIDSIYLPGTRSSDWVKLKITNDDEFIIGGFTEARSGTEKIGALLLGKYEDSKLVFTGKCGTGWNEKDDAELHAKFIPYEQNTSSFTEKITNDTPVHWLQPKLIATIKFAEKTKDGKLRHPVFKTLRDDKNATIKKHPAMKEDNYELKIGKVKLKLTNQNKIYFPDDHITKGNVVDYYDSISDYILPYLKNRPLSLNRHPNGIYGSSFYQKDIESKPEWLETVPIFSEHNNQEINYAICNDKAGLIYFANLGCIEMNPWLSQIPKIDQPDYLVIDLDPEDIEFKKVIEVALATKEVYDSLGITSFVKTSGSTGIHIYIHVAQKYDFEIVRKFAEFIAQRVNEEVPAITSLERSPKNRQKKVYVDYLQNRKGQTLASAYSLRPKPGATVSWPLFWTEVTFDLKMEDYNIFNVPELLKTRDDPWKELHKTAVNLLKVLKK
ncbi:DNA ligase D [Solitalea koreensis]|uniref:DNA ligase (ATP) n=1 Tax=Solitalea koreensis TaxID=543615 RepID=A0A521DF46_9SPHI|nr:DNA ligase D [Solitalea koreensis]SMO69761.1 bifunctional non-homologous end joining protein LigD [Solitalea koreensis]